MVVPNFVRQALATHPITVFGDGKQSRCFSHVHDVVRALIDLMSTPDAYGNVYNIGNNQEITIHDLAKQVREVAAVEVRDRLIALREGLRRGLRGHAAPHPPDTSKIKALVGWQPTIAVAADPGRRRGVLPPGTISNAPSHGRGLPAGGRLGDGNEYDGRTARIC